MKQFKNSMGRYYLQALFYETTLSDKSTVLYTLKRQDHEGYPSLFRLYLEESDPTEYRFAVNHLGGWDHWEELSAATFFQDYLEAWRRELEIKIRSEALNRVREISADPEAKSQFMANKFLLEGGWKPADAKKRGRPDKESLRREIIAQAASMAEIEEDAKRILS